MVCCYIIWKHIGTSGSSRILSRMSFGRYFEITTCGRLQFSRPEDRRRGLPAFCRVPVGRPDSGGVLSRTNHLWATKCCSKKMLLCLTPRTKVIFFNHPMLQRLTPNLEPTWAQLGPNLSQLEAILGQSGTNFGHFQPILKPPDPYLRPLGPSRGQLRAILGQPLADLSQLEVNLRPT